MKTTTESNAATDSRPDAQVIPFPAHAVYRTPPQAVEYEQTKEYEERVARIREKITRINKLVQKIQENNRG